jgi:hypothetical protein
MSRMRMVALAAALVLGGLSTAEARHGGGSHGGSYHSGGHGHYGGYHGGYRGFHYGYRRYYRPYIYSGYSSCWRWQQVRTRYGWVSRRVNVCYAPYAYQPYGLFY